MKRLLLFPLLAGLLATPLAANDDAADAKVAPLMWPDSSPTRLTVETHSETFDQVPITMVQFSGAGVRIATGSNGEWTCQPDAGPRESLLLRNYDNADVKLCLAIYPRMQFLRDLEPATWQRYLAGLRTRHGPALVDLQDMQDTTYFLGRHTREVVYTVQPAGDQPARMHREIFALVGDKVVIATVEGDPNALQHLHRAANQFLTRLNLVD